MYPILIRIGTFEITSFGVLVAVAMLTGLWVFRRELMAANLPIQSVDAGAIGVFGGLVGAKVVWAVEHAGSAPFVDLVFSRGGLSWYGGLIGGVGAGIGYIAAKGWPVIRVVSAATPALAIGHLIGRIGCFLVGDDYGLPSSLPWAVAFPEGRPPTMVPVHPTQLYEAIGLGVLAWLLMRWRRHRVADTVVVGRYLVGAGLLRFAIQFLRTGEHVMFGLGVAHFFAIAAMAIGLTLASRRPISSFTR